MKLGVETEESVNEDADEKEDEKEDEGSDEAESTEEEEDEGWSRRSFTRTVFVSPSPRASGEPDPACVDGSAKSNSNSVVEPEFDPAEAEVEAASDAEEGSETSDERPEKSPAVYSTIFPSDPRESPPKMFPSPPARASESRPSAALHPPFLSQSSPDPEPDAEDEEPPPRRASKSKSSPAVGGGR